MASETLRVTSFFVLGLFGLYDHKVTLNLSDRVTIVHGPNGVGKTVLIRMVAALLSGQIFELARVPFRMLSISFDGNRKIEVEPSGPPGPGATLKVRVSLRPDVKPAETEVELRGADINEWASRIAEETGVLSRMGPDQWLDRRTGDVIGALQVINRYEAELLYTPSKRKRPIKRVGVLEEFAEYQELRRRVRVHMIETQRLLRTGGNEVSVQRGAGQTLVPTVRDCARDLQERVSETMSAYARESQGLDQTFPERLIKGAMSEPMSAVSELKERMGLLETQRLRLQKIGLLLKDAHAYPFDVATLDNLDQARVDVLRLYVRDTAKKLDVLAALATRVELLLRQINEKFFDKSIRLERAQGLVLKGHNDASLPLEALSSGEQHEIVVLYDLLFRVEPNTLVLIDEPELSLHVEWQKKVLPELLDIVKAVDIDVVLATHSPFIVGDRSDLMVALNRGPLTT